jgi:ATP-dependent Lon protease
MDGVMSVRFYLPERNGADLKDVPESVRAEMAFQLASAIDQVLGHA